MKKIIILTMLTISITSWADIDATTDKDSKPTPEEVKNYRACFKELADQGCGHPSEGLEYFRSCMSGAFIRLSPTCQQMMSTLYGK